MRSRATKTELLLTAGDLDRAWWQDAQPYNFDVRSVEQLRSRGPAVKPLSGEDLDRRVLERLTEFDATFTDRDVRAAALVAGVGLDVDEALCAVDRLTARGELLVHGPWAPRPRRRAARTEDRALESAHADRQQGRGTLVVAQTSNEHLDELNARAQAIRIQHDELGVQEVALSGRPYGLRAGDKVQVRHPVTVLSWDG